MMLLQWLLIILALTSVLISIHLIWTVYRLRSHPCIEPVEIALPELSDELNQMLNNIAHAADISITPSLFIRRAALPNAFVVATFFRPELYLTDELLEHCNEIEHGLEKLTHILCHECAHIKRNDSIRLGLLTYALQWTAALHVNTLHLRIQHRIDHIETQADCTAKQIFRTFALSSDNKANAGSKAFANCPD